MRCNQYIKELERHGQRVVRQSGSHKIVTTVRGGTYALAIHEREDIGPKMLARLNKAILGDSEAI
jgi:predicted RNA binding protein YcfA (HicA-like mRNA interferase family)